MRAAVFLDRDGVLNRLVPRGGRLVSPRLMEEFHLLPGVSETVQRLRSAGLLVVVVTNQPDIARGLMNPQELERMHMRLRSMVQVDAIYACCHDDSDRCFCRKPKPGLLIQASREMEIDLSLSCVIGDSWKDIGAGRNAGCKTFLIQGPEDPRGVPAAFVVPSLQAAVELIVKDPAPG